MENKEIKTYRLIIKGKVQNVGFRYWLYVKAIKKNISGWVKNKITGEVEALLVGNVKDVNDLIKQCEKGFSSSNVTKIEIKNYQKDYVKKSFDILSTS